MMNPDLAMPLKDWPGYSMLFDETFSYWFCIGFFHLRIPERCCQSQIIVVQYVKVMYFASLREYWHLTIKMCHNDVLCLPGQTAHYTPRILSHLTLPMANLRRSFPRVGKRESVYKESDTLHFFPFRDWSESEWLTESLRGEVIKLASCRSTQNE